MTMVNPADSDLFSFVENESVRHLLARDANEIASCLDTQSYKSALVTCGSLLEALLVFALDVYGTDTAEMKRHTSLHEALAAANQLSIISDSTRGMCQTLNNYRNLIHPAVETRGKEKVTENRARSAWAALQVVAEEVGEFCSAISYRTLVTPFLKDRSALSVVRGDIAGIPVERQTGLYWWLVGLVLEGASWWQGDASTTAEARGEYLDDLLYRLYEQLPPSEQHRIQSQTVTKFRELGRDFLLYGYQSQGSDLMDPIECLMLVRYLCGVAQEKDYGQRRYGALKSLACLRDLVEETVLDGETSLQLGYALSRVVLHDQTRVYEGLADEIATTIRKQPSANAFLSSVSLTLARIQDEGEDSPQLHRLAGEDTGN